MPRDLFDVFVIVCEYILLCTVWSCWVQNIHRSFVGSTDVELSDPQLPFVIRGASASAPSYRRSPQRPDGFPEKSAWGSTPLHWAALNGHVAAAELVLSKGGAVDAKDMNGPGLNPGSRRQTSRSRTWGTSKSDKSVSGLKFLHFH